VGFWRWLTSSKADRTEWRRRRDAATHTTATARTLHAYERYAEGRLDQARQERVDLKGQRRQARVARQAAKAQARQAKQTRKPR
jgi:hypothetical protein